MRDGNRMVYVGGGGNVFSTLQRVLAGGEFNGPQENRRVCAFIGHGRHPLLLPASTDICVYATVTDKPHSMGT
jgi:hypothetical protein